MILTTYSSVPNTGAGRNKRAVRNCPARFSKINKGAGWNFFFIPWKLACRRDFFLKINKRACTSIRYTRVCDKTVFASFP